MELRELIGRIGATYDRSLGKSGEAQGLLRDAAGVLEGLVPAGMVPEGSGGRGNASIVPWIAVFQPDETSSATSGMYVVYLFSADMTSVVLSLNQGVTELIDAFGTRKGRVRLADQARSIREAMPSNRVGKYESEIDLHTSHQLPKHYEFGNIVAKTYDLANLPDEQTMRSDLQEFIRLYDIGLELRNKLRVSQPDTIFTTAPVEVMIEGIEFKPKDDADYIQHVNAQTLRKRRDHERVVKYYGEYLREGGFKPNTKVHPRDLTATRGDQHWLIEVKVVYRGDGVQATRDALSQLLMYRDFLYSPSNYPYMLAVFSEPVGYLNVSFLEKYEIASVWKEGNSWLGSPIAFDAGLSLKGY